MISEEMKKRIEFYFNQKKKVHISCIENRFYNGIIQSINSGEETLMFLDNYLGEVIIYFNEIRNVEPQRRFKDGRN